MYGSWSCSDLKNLHFRFDKETSMYRQFHLQKATELYCDLWKLFCSKWTEIIVEIQLIWFWLANVLCLLSDYRKEEIIRSMNLINGTVSAQEVTQFTRYTPPNSPFNVIVCIIMYLNWKSLPCTWNPGKITLYISYSFGTVHHKLCLRKAFGVPHFETFIITPCRIYGKYDAKCYH